MSYTENTQVTPIKDYDVSRMVFSEPIPGAIPDSKPKIEFKRINISTKNEDGTIGELILPTTRLFSFGVSENTSQETGNINGYTFPICLWSKEPTQEEKDWTDLFNKIVDKCIDHLIDTKEEIDMYDLTRGDLTKSKGGLNPLYWKKEKYTNEQGKPGIRIVQGTGPTLYTKLIFSKKNNKFLSQFYDINDEPINALDLMGKYCYTTAAIKIESIFIGSKISLQVKLYEAVIELTSNGMRRLLSNSGNTRPQAQTIVKEQSSSSNHMLDYDDNDDEQLESSSITDDKNDILTIQEQPQTHAKRQVKKVVRKTA